MLVKLGATSIATWTFTQGDYQVRELDLPAGAASSGQIGLTFEIENAVSQYALDLNDDWRPDYAGELELWDKAMTRCEVSVAPLLGRAVVFNTALDSYHGQPDPLTCPPDRDRRSIATYYYTALPAGDGAPPDRTTSFKPRPRSDDKPDWRIRSVHFIREWVPPKLQPIARKLNFLDR